MTTIGPDLTEMKKKVKAIKDKRARARANRPHIGFCMYEYKAEICWECPTLTECLKLRDRERREYPE